MINLTTRLCWEFVKKDGYIAIWKKPMNNSCYLSRDSGVKPPLCDVDDDPDKVWYAYFILICFDDTVVAWVNIHLFFFTK